MSEFLQFLVFACLAIPALFIGCAYRAGAGKGSVRVGLVALGAYLGIVKLRHPRAGKDIYRWVQLRPDIAPQWLIVGSYRDNGEVIRLDPMIPCIVWYDGLVTPAR